MTKRAAALGQALRAAVKLEWSPVSDRELLRRYAEDGAQEAFAAVVRRHTGLVLGVCRRALDSPQDAEDACQATFLILARKARSGRWQPSIANWLYTTARKVAHDARRAARRRAAREGRAAVPEAVPPADPMLGQELQEVLDEELDRLSPIYREALVLCYLEGLTRDEVATRLGVPAGTVKIRLERGRKRLGDALTKRGCGLGIGLLALAATSPAGAAPPRLVQAVLAAASGSASAAVAALAKGVAVRAFICKSVPALAAAAGLAALGFGLGSVSLSAAGQPPGQPPRAVSEQGPANNAGAKPDEAPTTATYAGRVLGPDGKPVAGAKLYALYYTPKVLPIPQRATSGPDGGFRFTVERSEFDRSASARPWDEAIVVALAEGYGLGFPVFQPGQMPSPTQLTVQLVADDVPITGRIIDLQGRPVAGATAVVHQLWWPSNGNDLTAWLAALKQKKELLTTLMQHRMAQTGGWMGRDVGSILPPAVTDAEGRFRLTGVGRERVVALRIAGPTIVVSELWAMTRPGETVQVALYGRGTGSDITFAGANFDYVAAPCRPIVGVVRDGSTGRPIPGAVVESFQFAGSNMAKQTQLRAVADREGRYRLLGMPRGKGNTIRVTPPEGRPYLAKLVSVPDGPGLEPVTVDVQLKGGVWIAGRVTDRATGRPVPSWVWYAIFRDNPNRREAVGLSLEPQVQTRPDGTFRFVGLPGRGIVTARATAGHYRTHVGAERVKDLDRFVTPLGEGAYSAPPAAEFHAVAEVNPEKGAESVTCDLVLEPGRTLAGTIVGPDGRPVPGALVHGLERGDVWDYLPAAAEFSAFAPNPGEQRLLQFAHAEKNLAGSLVVRGDDAGPLTIRLGPAGVLTGRFVTTDSQPLADLELSAPMTAPMAAPGLRPQPDLTAGSFPHGSRTDKDGRFRIGGLAPGLTYRLALLRGMYMLFPEGDVGKGVTVLSGETKDLGELKVRLPD